MNYTDTFTTTQIFNRAEVIEWAQALGKANGMVIIILNSEKGGVGRKPRLVLGCERSGTFQPSKNAAVPKEKKRETGTKKCKCPFKLKCTMVADDQWCVEVVSGVHNHPMMKTMEGHSYLGRLSEQETEILAEMSNNLVKPRQILNTLKTRDEKNSSTMKTIYNARQRHRTGEMAGRSQMQQLLLKLSQNNYIEWHTINPETDAVTCLFYAHPSSIDLLKSFPEVLIMDCTYKTNRYKLPLLQIVGTSSTDLTFAIAFVYLEAETEDYYSWALDKLKVLLHGCILPRVILTDRELALMNALQRVFPSAAHHLCRFHINRNIQGTCKKLFKTQEKWEDFILDWNFLVFANTEEDYMIMLGNFEKKYVEQPIAIAYVKESWLIPYKERFVSVWTDKQLHFGNTTTNRAESAHNKLKKFLGASNVSFDESWRLIHSLLELQHTEIKASFEKSLSTVQHKFKSFLFKNLRNFISKCALELIYIQMTRANAIGPNIGDCGGCISRRTHGLPCAHEIAEYQRDGRPIPLSAIHNHWKKLTLEPVNSDSKLVLSCKYELEQLEKRFNEANDATKIHLLKKIKELADPATTYVLEPEIKKNTRGRPAAVKKKKSKTHVNSTNREPSKWEYESMEFLESQASAKKLKICSQNSKIEICTPKLEKNALKMVPVIIESPKKLEKLKVHRNNKFLMFFPDSIRAYIDNIENVASDGNCGYRCIASSFYKSEEEWPQVRIDLLDELEKHQGEYLKMFGSEQLSELKNSFNYFNSGPCPFDKWMTMPEAGYVIASCYNSVVVFLSNGQCLTFLPLRTTPPPVPQRRNISIGFVDGNHFVKVLLVNNAPMPPVATYWERHRHVCARGWEAPYRDRILQFKNIIGNSVATHDVFIDITQDNDFV